MMFKTNLSEITSISLEHSLQIDSNNIVTGEFMVSGEYKMVDTSVNVEAFSFNIPFEVSIDEKYAIDNVIIDIYDFYYEIINNNVLSLNIEVIIDRLQEKSILESIEPEEIKEVKEEIKKIEEVKLEQPAESPKNNQEDNESKEEQSNDREEIKTEEITSSLFDDFDNRHETYTTYKVYIVKEGDTLDVVIQNYGTSKEELELYNNVNELNIGDRLIIPLKTDETNQ